MRFPIIGATRHETPTFTTRRERKSMQPSDQGMRDFTGKVALVTGAGSGIGLAISQAFLDAGMQVMLTDLHQENLDAAMDRLRLRDPRTQRRAAAKLDVTDRQAMAMIADRCEHELGPLHVIVNNAGVGVEGPILEAEFSDWDFGLGVNLGGVVNGLQILLPRIRRHGRGGYVVNTASLAAFVTMPSHLAIYAAAKAAVVALSEAIRPELQRESIGLSVLCPGPVRSNIHELTRNVPPGHALGASFQRAAETLSRRSVSPLWMSADEAAHRLMTAMRHSELYVITHGEWRDTVRLRAEAILAAMPTEVNPELIASLRAP
jgi:NAD(P)-dependent dehydrogenase (short-subunit alcohol dehydrogenase family)